MIDPDTVSEDDATTTITVTAALNRDARTEDTEVTVAVGKDSDSAVAGTDYTTVSDLRVTIPAGSRMATETFSFAPINDTVAEGSETVSVTGTADSLDVTAATLTITDNDQASDAITLLIDPDTVSEDDTTTTITVTAALNRDARTEDTEVTVAVGKDSDSAVAGTDYTTVSDLRVTIPAGSRMATETFSFAPINDIVAEGSETVSVTGTADSLDVTAATLTITETRVVLTTMLDAADGSVEFDEDTSYRFQTTDFGFRDANERDFMVSVRITSMPTKGLLRVSGTPAAAGQTVSMEEIDNGELTFASDANQHGSPYASFGFRVSDVKDQSETANVMTLNVRSVNDPAKGQPIISGAVEKGKVLHALTSQIRDIDGMTGASFEYQWIRQDGGNEVEILEANSSTLLLVAADVGSTLKVRVQFTDDDGFNEELFSDPTDAIEPARSPTGVPLNLAATPEDRTMILEWEPPASDGGAEISDYEIRFAGGAELLVDTEWKSAGTDLAETIMGLDADQRYRFEVRAVNSIGPGPAASTSAVTPRPKRISAALIEGWLARFGRTAGGDTVELIRQRLQEGPQRNQLVLYGHTVGNLTGQREAAEAKTFSVMRMPEFGTRGYLTAPEIAPDFKIGMENGRGDNASMGDNHDLSKLSDVLQRSSFYYASAQEPKLRRSDKIITHTLWGGASSSRFNANIDSLSLDGEVITGTIGYDRHIGRLLTGVALSYSDGEGRFQDPTAGFGVIASDLFGVYPYVYYQMDRRNSLWGVFGFGKGELQLIPDGASFQSAAANLNNTTAAFGGRGVLSNREGASRSFELALRGDALLTNTSTDSTSALVESKAFTRRLRLMLEATGSIRGANGVFNPTLEAGFRHDAGDAEQGMGFELGSGLAWSAAPITVQLNGRGLLAHEDESYREWGYSVSIQYQHRNRWSRIVAGPVFG